MEQIRVVLADDHPVFRAGIKAGLLASGTIDVVGEASNGREALEVTRRLKPDILLLDMDMPELDGMQVARQLRDEDSTVRVVPLSGYSEPEYVFGFLDAGGSGFISKDESMETIIQAVHTTMLGKVYMSPTIAQELVTGQKMIRDRNYEVDEAYRELADMGITPKMLGLIRLVAEGYNNREIASIVHRSEHTVKNQVTRIQDLVNISWRPALVAWAWTSRIMLLDVDFYAERFKSLRMRSERSRRF